MNCEKNNSKNEIDPDELVEKLSAGQIKDVIVADFSARGWEKSLGSSNWAEADDDSFRNLDYALLRYLLDDTRSRMIWQALENTRDNMQGDDRKKLDRDHAIYKLWNHLDEHEEWLKNSHHSIHYHRHYLFGWFLSRYHLSKARSVYSPALSWFVVNIHWPLLALLVLPALSPGLPLFQDKWCLKTYVVASYVLIVFTQVICGCGQQYGVLRAIQSLIPRLAGMVLVGYLFLISSEGLRTFVLEHVDWMRGTFLIILAAGYLVLEMGHRVHPVPGTMEMTTRSASLLATAACHAFALTLFCNSMMATLLNKLDSALQPQQVFALAMSSLFLGMVLNVIWAEEPVTTPL